MTIASRLDEAMKAARFKSQAALARASGVPQPTINRILKGSGKNGPETATLLKLAATCNVTFEWLREGLGAPGRGMAVGEPKSHPAATPRGVAENDQIAGYSLTLEKLLFINAISEKEAAILRKYRLATERGKEIIEASVNSAPKQALAAVVHDQANS